MTELTNGLKYSEDINRLRWKYIKEDILAKVLKMMGLSG